LTLHPRLTLMCRNAWDTIISVQPIAR
jgi:hypothetical protein